MAKKQKKFKPKARLPRGFGDRSPSDIRATDEMVSKIREVYERYGFDPIETPMFEYTEALGKFLPDTDRPNAGVFSLQDDDDQWMSLRYDLTAPLARHVAEDFQNINLPYRTYRQGWVFRNEKPGPGRFRQFMQFDADTVGAPGVQADAEMCMMMADTMEALGIKRGDYVIRVNNRKILDGIMDSIGFGGDEYVAKRLNILRAIDKLDKFGNEGVELLLGKGRLDESGDFTEGAGLSDEQVTEISNLLLGPELDTILDYSNKEAENSARESNFHINSLFYAGASELRHISKIVQGCGYENDRIRVDYSCVRGLEYYTGPVFEAELLFDVTNEKGQTVQFGSVGGGGRYDGLVQRFMGQAVPATGFSIGVSRLMTALKNLGKLETDTVLPPVVVCVMDKDAESLGRYQKLVQRLRDAKPPIRAEMFQGNPKNFGKQLQYADRRGCPVAIIQGADERDKGEVQIKDLLEGKKIAEGIESREEWTQTRAAQFSVKEADLVEEVQKVLARYQGGKA